MNRSLVLIFVLFSWFSLTGELCTKALVYGKDYRTQPKAELYENGFNEVMETTVKTLENMGYKVHHIDEAKGQVVTGWMPVESDSHYFDLFGRKDFGASDGAYYQLIVDFFQVGSKVKVSISTVAKTIVGRLHTNNKLERKIHRQLADLLRAPQIQMTNVGVDKK